METSWVLDNIYTSVDSEEFKCDMAAYERLVDELNTFARESFTAEAEPVTVLHRYIAMKNALTDLDRLSMYVSLSLAVDTSNQELLSVNDRLERTAAGCAEHEALFVAYLKQIDDIDSLFDKDELLREHSYFITESKALSEHTLSPAEEVVISRMQNTGSSLWAKQWEQLTSNLDVTLDINGEKRIEPLSAVRNMAYSKDGELRKAAYKAELASYEAVKVSAAFCMSGIKGEVITLADMRSYKSPLAMTVEQSRLTEDILNAMWSAIEDALPRLTQYFTVKAKLLGHKDGKLPFYDLFAPVGEDRKYTLEQARDEVISAFTAFSPEMGAFAQNAFDKRWIDLMPKKGKTGGAFCEAVHSIGESRILTNFGGTFNDVVTIAHELGHAFHDSRLNSASAINSFYPMPIAETASTLCESILINHTLERADKDFALVILENDLSGIMQTISDIYSRFIFEDSVFSARRDGALSADMLCSLMLDAQKKAYGNTLAPDYMHSFMWLCKPHYYDADFNYYNFPYAFGMLLSRALYGRYKQLGKDFVPLYDKFLSATGTMPLADVAKTAGFDLKDKAFWQSGLDSIQNELDSFIDLTGN